MSTHMIGYDLHPKAGETYADLIEAIKKLGSWWHHLDSTWLVISQLTAVEIGDRLLKYLKSDDQLLVITVSGDAAAWTGFDQNGSAWIKNNL